MQKGYVESKEENEHEQTSEEDDSADSETHDDEVSKQKTIPIEKHLESADVATQAQEAMPLSMAEKTMHTCGGGGLQWRIWRMQ